MFRFAQEGGTRFASAGAPGSGVIWNAISFETLVIPAKTGIQSVGGAFPMGCAVDSRLRGNDRIREACVPQMTPLPRSVMGFMIEGFLL